MHYYYIGHNQDAMQRENRQKRDRMYIKRTSKGGVRERERLRKDKKRPNEEKKQCNREKNIQKTQNKEWAELILLVYYIYTYIDCCRWCSSSSLFVISPSSLTYPFSTSLIRTQTQLSAAWILFFGVFYFHQCSGSIFGMGIGQWHFRLCCFRVQSLHPLYYAAMRRTIRLCMYIFWRWRK